MGGRAGVAAGALALASLAMLSPCFGQTHKDRRLGFQFKPPKDFRSVALNPTEKTVVAKYQDERTTYGAKGMLGYHSMFTVSFYPADEDAAQDEDPFDAALERIEAKAGYFEIERDKRIKIAKAPCRELTTLQTKRMSSGSVDVNFYYAMIQQNDGLFVLRGDALGEHYSKARNVYAKAARSFRRIEKDDSAARDAELSQLDDQERFLQEQIAKLPKDWKWLRTDRYLFLFNAEASFVKQMAKQIEALRNVYERLYPPDKPIEAVSIVRVCNSRDEYHGYGGPSGSGGYWSSRHKELVFFDKRPRSETLCVLNHEAFHQYIYYYYGELAPHSWYNEGHGDYFSGARMTRTYRITAFKNAPGGFDRSQFIKDMARLARQGKRADEGAAAPLRDLMHFHKAEYYSKGGVRPVAYYPQGWALVHMLREGKGLKPKWKQILPEYLQSLLAAREDMATETMEKLRKNAEKIKQGSSEDMSSDPKDYYDRVNKDEIQDLAYDKTFASWTDSDWAVFEAFYLKYCEKL